MGSKIDITGNGDDQKYRSFLPLLVENKEKIYGYILTLVPRSNFAEDILQETVLVMWEKFHSFKIGTNFCAWGKCIALNKVREFRRKSSVGCILDEDIIDQLTKEDEAEENNLLFDRLEKCLKFLSKVEAKLVRLRFTDGVAVKSIALSWGKTPEFIYREMSKILYKLRECILVKN